MWTNVGRERTSAAKDKPARTDRADITASVRPVTRPGPTTIASTSMNVAFTVAEFADQTVAVRIPLALTSAYATRALRTSGVPLVLAK